MSEESKPLDETQMAAALNAAFDATNIHFHSRRQALANFRQGHEITYEDGVAHSVYDGVRAPLADCLSRFAFDRRELVDGRTLPREGVGSSRPGVASKAELRTVADKVKFIAENGSDAFDTLPLTSPDTSELRTFEQWLKLPTAEKARLISLDPDIVQKLTRTPSQRQNGLWQKPGLQEELARKNPSLKTPGWSGRALRAKAG